MDGTPIAPCGFPCVLCSAYQNKKHPCHGCRSSTMQKHCVTCKIRCCDNRSRLSSGFCCECSEFPCGRLKRLDAAYRKNYHASPIANLNRIRELGAEAFWQGEKERWTCPTCGELTCLHTGACQHCGAQAE